MKSTKVLIVEDESIVARVISQELTFLGYIVTGIATSDVAALASVRDQKPDIVLVDIVLKGSKSDGVSLAANFRQEFQLPVIYITAHTDDATLERAKNTEPYGYLIKPFNERDLLVALETALYKHKMQEQLRQSEERYRYLAESIPQLVWTATTDGVLLDVNQRWIDFTSLTLAQAQIEGWEVIVHPDDLATLSQNWAFAQQNGIFYQAEGRMRRADGMYRWHLHQAKPLKNEQGQIIKWFGTATDIEEQKQLEQQNATLLQKLEERNQELDRFSYIVSHDLKSPLRAVGNLAEWLEDDISDLIPPENQQQLQLIKSRVYRMEELINGLLKYARIAREDIPLDLVSVEELLKEVVDSLAPPPTFIIEIASPLPTYHTKRILLHQVLANLIGNAIKHHDRLDGKVKITVQDYQDFYEFSIVDDGRGIDAKEQTRVFDIFQTVESQSTNQSTGIGLAIVKKIVETEGGKIQLKSEIGQGSTFSFTWRKYSNQE